MEFVRVGVLRRVSIGWIIDATGSGWYGMGSNEITESSFAYRISSPVIMIALRTGWTTFVVFERLATEIH